MTRSNPRSNDRRSLTLIKGGQLTRGPGVTFIRRLVKVYFSLALNTAGAHRTGAGYLDLGSVVVVVAVGGEGAEV